LRSFEANAATAGDQVLTFDLQQMMKLLDQVNPDMLATATAPPLVLHFWNPDCDCNRFNTPHVRRIIERYAQQGVRFVTVTTTAPGTDRQALLAEAKNLFGVPAVLAGDINLDLSGLATSPAAAVIASGGELAYYGPYSDSAFCGANGSAFVEKTLDGILSGQAVQARKALAFGCFCPWTTAALGNELTSLAIGLNHEREQSIFPA